MKNILIALDFTEVNHKLLEHAEQLGRAFDAKLWLVHVAAPDPSFVGYEVGPQHIRDNRAEELREEHREIQGFASDLVGKGVQAEALLIQGPTVDTLLKKAQDISADLLIIGAHQRGFWSKLIFGSTWEEIIRQSKLPLLVIPA